MHICKFTCVYICMNVRVLCVYTCSVLQCVAMCCSVLQCVAVCCSVLQCVAVCDMSCVHVRVWCVCICNRPTWRSCLIDSIPYMCTCMVTQVSFGEYRLFYRALLQKRPIILATRMCMYICVCVSYIHTHVYDICL